MNPNSGLASKFELQNGEVIKENVNESSEGSDLSDNDSNSRLMKSSSIEVDSRFMCQNIIGDLISLVVDSVNESRGDTDFVDKRTNSQTSSIKKRITIN